MFRILNESEKNRLHVESYSKLIDDIYIIGTNTVLRLNVALFRTDANGHRYLYHKELGFKDDTNKLSYSIKRSFDYYLTIENFVSDKDGNKVYIQIRLQNIPSLRLAMEEVYKWYTSSKYKSLYALNENNELIMPRKVSPILIDDLPMGSFISFVPIVLNYNNDYGKSMQQSRGVRIFLNSDTKFIDISINKFFGFYQAIKDINLFQSAQNLLNYFGRPPYGTNGYVVDNSSNAPSIQAKSRRQIGDDRKKSFDDLF